VPSDELMPEELFVCRNCGSCCSGFGGTYLSAEDIGAIADYVQVPPADFIDRYCCGSGGKTLLAQQSNGYCIFWDRLCTIHPVKPRMCRRWPFIESILVDPINWWSMASCCHGMRTDIPPSRVRARVAQILGGRWLDSK
jgi:uncharacterized protein